jgi:hypothetical protein
VQISDGSYAETPHAFCPNVCRLYQCHGEDPSRVKRKEASSVPDSVCNRLVCTLVQGGNGTIEEKQNSSYQLLKQLVNSLPSKSEQNSVKSILNAGVANTSDSSAKCTLTAVSELQGTDNSSAEGDRDEFHEIPEDVITIASTLTALATVCNQDDPQATSDAIHAAEDMGYNGALVKFARKAYARQMKKAIAKGTCSLEQISLQLCKQEEVEKLLRIEKKSTGTKRQTGTP